MPHTSDINKKDMTEEDIKNRFVTPALAGTVKLLLKGRNS